MKKVLMSASALVFALALVATAQAGGNGPSKGGNNSSSHHQQSYSPNYQQSYSHNLHNNPMQYAQKFSFGYSFPKNSSHWSYYCWSPKYCCNFYWCPSTCCYYYYCQPQSCYYPISYITSAPPQAPAVAAATASVSQVVNVQTGVSDAIGPQVVQAGTPAPPPGAGPVQPYTPPSR